MQIKKPDSNACETVLDKHRSGLSTELEQIKWGPVTRSNNRTNAKKLDMSGSNKETYFEYVYDGSSFSHIYINEHVVDASYTYPRFYILILIKLQKAKFKTNEIEITITEFKEALGIQDRKTASGRFFAASKMFLTGYFQYRKVHKNSNKTECIERTLICKSGTFYKSRTVFKINDEYLNVVKRQTHAFIPDRALRYSNEKKHALHIVLFLYGYKCKNTKPSHDMEESKADEYSVVKLETLIKECSGIKSKESVNNRNYREAISTPVLKDLKYVCEDYGIKFNIIDSDGTYIPYHKALVLPYKKQETLLIEYALPADHAEYIKKNIKRKQLKAKHDDVMVNCKVNIKKVLK